MSVLVNSENNFNVLLKRDNNSTENNNYHIDLPENNIPHILIGDVMECLRRVPDKSINVGWELRPY